MVMPESRKSGTDTVAVMPTTDDHLTMGLGNHDHRYRSVAKQLRLLSRAAENDRDAAALQALQDDLARAAPLEFQRASELGGDGDV